MKHVQYKLNGPFYYSYVKQPEGTSWVILSQWCHHVSPDFWFPVMSVLWAVLVFRMISLISESRLGSQCLWSSTEVDQVWVASKVVEQYAMWVKLWSVCFFYYLEFRSMTFLLDHVPQKFTCIAQLSEGNGAHTAHSIISMQHDMSQLLYGAVKGLSGSELPSTCICTGFFHRLFIRVSLKMWYYTQQKTFNIGQNDDNSMGLGGSPSNFFRPTRLSSLNIETTMGQGLETHPTGPMAVAEDTEHSLNTLRHACIMDGQGQVGRSATLQIGEVHQWVAKTASWVRKWWEMMIDDDQWIFKGGALFPRVLAADKQKSSKIGLISEKNLQETMGFYMLYPKIWGVPADFA